MKVCGEMLNAQEARLMGTTITAPEKSRGTQPAFAPSKNESRLKTAPNPFHECRQTGRAERRTHVVLKTEAGAESILVHPA